VNGDGQSTVQDYTPWCDALAYCENLDFAGHDDWRLPNVRELQSIVDYGRFNPSIDPVFGACSAWGWSSTSYANNPLYAWLRRLRRRPRQQRPQGRRLLCPGRARRTMIL